MQLLFSFLMAEERGKISGLLAVESEFDHDAKLLLGSINIYPQNHNFGCSLRLIMRLSDVRDALLPTPII